MRHARQRVGAGRLTVPSAMRVGTTDGWAGSSTRSLGRLAGNVGRGLAAGIAGTAAMTLSSSAEARLRGRDGSTTPVEAVERALGVTADGESQRQRLNSIAHWGYGTAWGGVRGAIGTTPLGAGTATAVHLGAVMLGEQAVLAGLGVSEPATRWPATEVAIDVFHHAVYVAATALAFAALGGGRRLRR